MAVSRHIKICLDNLSFNSFDLKRLMHSRDAHVSFRYRGEKRVHLFFQQTIRTGSITISRSRQRKSMHSPSHAFSQFAYQL